MIAHRLFFLRNTCWSVQLWICTNTSELCDFNVASVFDLSCSPGWSSSKISSENYTNTAESISNESGVLIPHAHCLWSANIAFSIVHSIDTACDMSHQITSYLTVCSTTHSCGHQAFTLLTLCEGVGHRWITSDTNVRIEFCWLISWSDEYYVLYWNDTLTIEYPCKLHVGLSVILCLIDIEHLYRLIQYEM